MLDKNDRYLFPGTSCFPLSPIGDGNGEAEKTENA